MGAASLESLTDKLFEQVVHHLDLHDIRNIRLVSRSTALKAVQDTYRSFFRKKHVDIRRKGLQSFVEATSQSGLGCLVEHLSLVAIVYDPKLLQTSVETGKPRRTMGSSRKVEPNLTAEKLEASKQDLAKLRRSCEDDEALRRGGTDLVLLREAFSHVALSKNGLPLKSLNLRIKIHRGDTLRSRPSSLWRSKQVFQAAIYTYRLAMECLCSSELKLQALDIFFDIPERLQCSLPCDISGKHLDPTTGGRLGSCLSTLKMLSISITDPILKETVLAPIETCLQDKVEDTASPGMEQASPKQVLPSSLDIVANEENYSALSSMLAFSPTLEELNIVFYELDCSQEMPEQEELRSFQDTMRTRHMQHLARAPPAPQLRKLYLASLSMHDTDLVTFLKSHVSSLRDLGLTDIRILPGRSFASIASYITGGETTQLVAIRFEDIRQGKELIHFSCDWEGEGVDSMDRDIVRRWGAERKGDIDYFGHEGGLLEWARAWEWTLEDKAREGEEEDE